jgi:hypothetical protein
MKKQFNYGIFDVALGLEEDIQGANGELDAFDIHERLVERIHDYTGGAYFATGMMPVGHVARIVRSVWEFRDRQAKRDLMVLGLLD